jgi:FKBP-type peptidyl-prolyl cis-trans isomerase FkpA
MNRFFLCRLVILGFVILAAGCDDDDGPSQAERLQKEIETIDNYLQENNIDAIKHSSGVRMHITTLGTGLPAKITSLVNIDYTGRYFTTGLEFDDGPNYNSLLEYTIWGWQYAFTSLPEGSTATLYIPSVLAYGKSGKDPVPPNALLIFDVKFNAVEKTVTETTQFKADTAAIESHLESNAITAVTDPSGVRYLITNAGAGPTPSLYEKVKFTYRFKNLNGTLIKEISSGPTADYQSLVVDYNNYVQALIVGLTNIAPGGSVTMYVPSYLAFGPYGAYDNGVQVIAPNANLIIELDLEEIVQ